MRELTSAQRLVILREAGNVERAHVLPHHGSYTVGKHSFDMALLLLVLHPDPSPELMRAVLLHDLGERYTGDVPYPAKRSDGELGKRLDQLERRALARLGISIQLGPEDALWLSALDQVEFLLWCKDQIAMGNANAASPYAAQLAAFQRVDLPPEVEEFLGQHVWTRTPDVFPK